jgi:predicted nucleic acid-binding protein
VASRFTVVLDACVLHSSRVRDVLVSLASAGLFRARWSVEIHEEWMKSVLARRPDLDRDALERTRELMDKAVRNCLVENYAELIPALSLPDPGDRHVLAAAIASGAGAIVTLNLRDFPRDVLARFGVEPVHPDAFVLAQIGLNPEAALRALAMMRSRFTRPPLSAPELVEQLRAELPLTAAFLREHLDRF